MRNYSFLLALCVIALVSCGQPDRDFTQTQYWFEEQLIDHSDPTDARAWKQRYWAVENFFKPENGAVILYICGEYTCPGVKQDRLFVVDLAKRYNALILVLEHRFYGNSMPFGENSLKLENMRYLNVHQALDDLAYFLGWIKNNKQFKVNVTNPWITVGGSYPGALSAWFRYKYPHLTVGALASSAVVNSKADYPEFDQQIYTSTMKTGQKCMESVRDAQTRAEELLSKPDTAQKLKEQFGSQQLNNGEFLFMFADIFVELIQYGKRTSLCDQLQGKSKDDVIAWAADYIKKTGGVESVQSYGSYYLKNEVYDPSNPPNSRSWTYQTCTEVGWLQTAPKDTKTAMRSQLLTLDFYKQWCKDSFGADLWPNTDRTNLYFGGENLNVPGLIMTNGDEDPWKHVSVIKRRPSQMFVVDPITCDDCAHCVELYTPTDNDSQALKDARERIMFYFDLWIGKYLQNNQQMQ